MVRKLMMRSVSGARMISCRNGGRKRARRGREIWGRRASEERKEGRAIRKGCLRKSACSARASRLWRGRTGPAAGSVRGWGFGRRGAARGGGGGGGGTR